MAKTVLKNYRKVMMKDYLKMTKAKLVRKIMMALKKLPKKKLALMCYELEKRRLPTISTTKKGMPKLTARPKAYKKPRKTKTKTKKRKLRAGIHFVMINGKKRKVKVNSKGQWRFMKQ